MTAFGLVRIASATTEMAVRRSKMTYSRPVMTTLAAPAWRRTVMPILLLAVAVVAACDRRPAATHFGAVHRLIVEPTDQILDLEALRKSFGYSRQSFDDAGQLRRWRTHDKAERVIEDGLMKVRPSGRGQPYIRLVHEVDLFAEDVREIVIVARGHHQDLLRLFWAIPGGGFVNQRGLWLEGQGSEEVAYRFVVAEHPAWRGRIRALRLDVPNIAGQEVAFRSFELRGREDYEAELLARIVGQDWKVELDHEVRDAVVTPPDVPRRWRLPEPAAGRLRFAYGLPRAFGTKGRSEAAPAVTFRVLAEGGKGAPLFEDTVDPRDRRRAGRWLQAEVELPPAGPDGTPGPAPGELVFEASAPAGYRIEAGLPAWAGPEILGAVAGERRPNVILISVDTLRADRLGLYGYGEPTSPNIDRWARSSAVTFRRAIATAPWTLPSHVSMLTGLDALRHGVNHHLPAPRQLEMLAEMLRREGYLTAAVTGGGWLHPDQGLAQGFDVFRYWGQGTGSERELEAGIQQALKLLRAERERELFLFLHTYEAHDPFRRRLPYGERCEAAPEDDGEWLYGAFEKTRQKSEGFLLHYRFDKWRPGGIARRQPIDAAELPRVSCLYDSGIAHVDRYLERLFRHLEALDPERRTLVILTSDHGESLGEDGYVKHAYLLDSNLLVPLVIGLPGGRHGGTQVDAQVSSVDLVPTILDAVGIEAPAGLDGSSLLPLIEGQVPAGPRQAWSYAGASNFGLSLRLDNRAKYVYNNAVWAPLGGAEELYDLQADGGDRHDQADASPRRLEGLRARAIEYLESHAHGVGIEIENHACGELTGELFGLPVHISRVKAARPPGERFEWLAKRRGGFRLAPGETLDLLLEAARGTMTIKAELGPCDGAESPDGPAAEARTFKHPVDLDRLEAWELGFDGTAWREVAGDGVHQARVVLRREGRSVTEPPPAEMDPALVEQLKALGYLDG